MVIGALVGVQAENGEAVDVNDKLAIDDFIRKSNGGFNKVNNLIKGFLRTWQISRSKALALNADASDFIIFGSVASILFQFDALEDALVYYKKNIDIFARTGREQNLARTYNNISLVYEGLGNFPKAMEMRQASIALSATPDASNLHNTASAYLKQGDYAKALEFYTMALDLKLALYGPHHPDTGSTFNNMAVVYEHLGKSAKALEFYNKALAIFKLSKMENHPDTAATYTGMAGLLLNQGDATQALEFFNKALTITLATLGPDHSDNANSYYGLAEVYNKQGKLHEALESFRKALKIFVVSANFEWVTLTRERIAHIESCLKK